MFVGMTVVKWSPYCSLYALENECTLLPALNVDHSLCICISIV